VTKQLIGERALSLKERGTLTNKDELHAIYHMMKASFPHGSGTHKKRILDADYSKSTCKDTLPNGTPQY
jgi:hypothetical protein